MTKTLNKISVAQITGGEHWYRHGINRRVLFTDGAKYVADQAEAFWPVDEIVLHPALRQAHCRRRIPSVEALG